MIDDEDFDDMDFGNIDDLPVSDSMDWEQSEEDIADDEFRELD
jgi:hypothetical protein